MKTSIGAQTVLHPHPVLVVGTYDAEGKANIATVAWGGICCSRPPSVAVSLRAATQTHGNILHREAFTVNIPSETHLAAADHAGVVSGRTVDKFETAGLAVLRLESVDAPGVDDFPLVLACRLSRTVEVGLHTQFIGEIVDVLADEDVLAGNGLPDITRVRPLLYATGNKAYFGVGPEKGKAFVHKEI